MLGFSAANGFNEVSTRCVRQLALRRWNGSGPGFSAANGQFETPIGETRCRRFLSRERKLCLSAANGLHGIFIFGARYNVFYGDWRLACQGNTFQCRERLTWNFYPHSVTGTVWEAPVAVRFSAANGLNEISTKGKEYPRAVNYFILEPFQCRQRLTWNFYSGRPCSAGVWATCHLHAIR
jgi:hypothetical protein